MISSGGGRLDAGHDPHQRAFAGAVFADDGQHFAALECERNVLERTNAGELLADVAHFEQGRIETEAPLKNYRGSATPPSLHGIVGWWARFTSC